MLLEHGEHEVRRQVHALDDQRLPFLHVLLDDVFQPLLHQLRLQLEALDRLLVRRKCCVLDELARLVGRREQHRVHLLVDEVPHYVPDRVRRKHLRDPQSRRDK